MPFLQARFEQLICGSYDTSRKSQPAPTKTGRLCLAPEPVVEAEEVVVVAVAEVVEDYSCRLQLESEADKYPDTLHSHPADTTRLQEIPAATQSFLGESSTMTQSSLEMEFAFQCRPNPSGPQTLTPVARSAKLLFALRARLDLRNGCERWSCHL